MSSSKKNHALIPVIISGGSGITPVMSMLRSLQRRTHRGRITFVHYAQSPDHQIFAAELDEVRRSGHGVDVHLLHPELGDPALSPAWLERLVPGYRDVPTWACGPAPLIEAVQAAYDGSDALRVEYFKPPRTASGPGEGEVGFSRSGKAAANTGAPLLEQAEALGLRPEYGCRMGICFSCVARMTEGTVRNIFTGEASSLAILPYEEVRTADDPRRALLAFCESAYEAGARLAAWDTSAFTSSACPSRRM